MGVHVFPILNSPFHLPPHPIPQGHPSAPALSTLSHASNLSIYQFFNRKTFLFGVMSKNSLTNLGQEDFSPKSFTVLCFTFRSMYLSLFKLIFNMV